MTIKKPCQKNISEFSIINEFFKPLTNQSSAAKNLADDVAKICLKQDEELLISQDIICEDVHFLKKDGGFKIASKLLRVNISDLAASGAKPLYYMLGFSKDNNMDQSFIKDFALGLKDVQEKFNLSLIGGDTVKSLGKLFFSITIFGSIKKSKTLSRANAKENDLIFVSGNIGDAAIGLSLSQKSKIFSGAKKDYFLEKHFFPTPRIKLGQELVKQNISRCAIDISDGLLSDLNHICQESNLTAIINQDKIPFSKHVSDGFLSKNISFLDLISAGDDYELIFTAKKSSQKKILQLAKNLKIKITAIGCLKKSASSPEVILLDNNNQIINFSKYGYEH